MRLALVVISLAAAVPARAYQIESTITSSCHEDITIAGVERAGFPGIDAPPPTEDQRRALDDLTFTLERRDVWMMALLIGVRSNDIRDFAPSDLASLVSVHNDPDDQQAHCLRASEDDGPAGDAAALARCRAFIVGELEAGGLLAESLDLAAEEPVSVYLAFRGRVTLPLPRFAYRLGRALHALEDSYTHAFREPGTGAVTHVLNWVDYVSGDLDEGVDGHAHASALDDCASTDPREGRRVARTTEAVTAVLAAIADPAPQRAARVAAIVDASLVLRPGCDFANRYCDAEELDQEADATGCTIAGGGLAMLAVVLVLVRRRRAIGTVRHHE